MAILRDTPAGTIGGVVPGLDGDKQAVTLYIKSGDSLIPLSSNAAGSLEIVVLSPVFGEILKELRITNVYLQAIVGDRMTEMDVES